MSSRSSSPARAASRAARLAIALSLLVLPFIGPAGASAMGAVPACRFDDVMTSPSGYDDWSTTLVDTILRVPRSYVPPDLVHVSAAGIPGDGIVRELLVDDLRAMTDAASAAGAAIAVESAYRSFDRQVSVFDKWVRMLGRPRALQVSARPGHSEHQLGLAIDFRSEPGGTPFVDDWATTPAGKWMRTHAWEYGFVMSYPKGKLDIVCYDYEPWHYRYVGRDLAAAIHDSGLTPREYLWTHFTTTTVDGPTLSPGVAASLAPSPPGSATPSAPLTASPAVEASDQAPASPSAVTPAPTPASFAPDSTPGPTAAPAVELISQAGLVSGLAVSLALVLGGLAVLAVTVLRRRRST
jgi:D-alanyl-D-alanine carboxypeptidase